MVKSFPNHLKASDQLKIPLVSESVPQSRQRNGVKLKRILGKVWPSILGSLFFGQGPVGLRMFQGCEKEGHSHKCFLNILLGGDWGNNS